MSYSAIGNQELGKFLQIAFSEGVRSQISQDYSDWEMVKMNRVSDPDGRELRFMFQTSFGPSAVAYRNPNFSGSFPTGQRISVSEYTANYKELEATIELEYNMWFAAQKSPSKYAEPLAMEINAKAVALKRRMAADFYGDGTGVVGQLPSSSATASSGKVVFSISDANSARGHIGFFEYGDILVLKAAAGGASALDTNLATEPAYWRVESKDRRNNTVTLQGLDSNLATVSVSSISVQPTAGDVFYRYQQPTIPDLTSISDYGTVSEVCAGLESLASADGRVIHGITMSGSSAATKTDAGGNPLDVSYIQQLLDDVKINVGPGAYSYKKMCAAPEAHAQLIESRETDRRFMSKDDAARGIKVFGYQHGNDFLEMYTSEYIKRNRLWVLPEAKGGNKVLEYYGTDFEPVRAKGGDEFMLAPASGGGHQRKIVSYMHSLGVLICKHPAAIGRLENFTV